MKVLLIGAVWFVAALGLASLIGLSDASAPCHDPSHDEAPAATPEDGGLIGLTGDPIAENLDQPSDMFTLPGHDELFVVEKPGRIVPVREGGIVGPPILNMTSLVLTESNEQGLLTVRPDPRFTETCLLYIFYTDVYGDSELATVRVSGYDPPTIPIHTLRHVLEIPQKQDWHQSGSMVFGPEGHLWVSVGDGGGIGDPHGYGQNPRRLEGTVLRLDVDAGSYQAPADNPFVDSEAGRDEVWAYGLRNPWRLSIDEKSGLIYIPDVGQEDFEEINIVDRHDGGLNFGWSITEGSGCYQAESCDTGGITQPVYEYAHHGNGCAVVGGQVYRGEAIPELAGQYFFADFCGGWVRSLEYANGEVVSTTVWPGLGNHRLLTTIGTDSHGELYIMTLDGGLWKIVAEREGSTT
jgi:glucose/arabinose dehydrogenase